MTFERSPLGAWLLGMLTSVLSRISRCKSVMVGLQLTGPDTHVQDVTENPSLEHVTGLPSHENSPRQPLEVHIVPLA